MKEIEAAIDALDRHGCAYLHHEKEYQAAIASLLALKEQEPVARLMTWVGKGTYPKKGYTVARTYEECHKDAYPNAWEEGALLFTHPAPEAKRISELEAQNAQLLEALKLARETIKMYGKDFHPEYESVVLADIDTTIAQVDHIADTSKKVSEGKV